MPALSRRRFLRLAAGGLAAAVGAAGPWTRALAQAGDGDYFERMRRFDTDQPGDLYLDEGQLRVAGAVLERLEGVQRHVGFGRFNVLGMDGLLRAGRESSRVGEPPRQELDFIEGLFEADARRYGFMGEKVLPRLSAEVPWDDIEKVPGSGQYLYRGRSLDAYREVAGSIGEDLVLTSGVRGVIKQLHLFLNKALICDGNLSRASRSLAPPGYSFHGIGDFDVGQKDLGRANFTRAFAETDVYRQLLERGYATLRYPEDNLLGVRYEPWHIRVV
jgi:hypothetical protein